MLFRINLKPLYLHYKYYTQQANRLDKSMGLLFIPKGNKRASICTVILFLYQK